MSIFYSMGTSDAYIDALSAPDLSPEAEERLAALEDDQEFLMKIRTEHEVIVATIEKRNQERPTQHIADALLEAKANVESVDLMISQVRSDIERIGEWDNERAEADFWDRGDWLFEQRRDQLEHRAG
ncbi:hypothetical protein [Asaia bogorensis]|uniref:hypothetical protein n=1 Tax=Asaia bogorensis TaxID=91915 RepID=UPI000EFCF009|nr:hypothetical protein [Asaia bogorensis]